MSEVKINVANTLTLLRLFLAIVFIFYLVKRASTHVTISIYVIICMSDFLDGIIARKSGCASSFGAIFDVYADLFFILSSCMTLNVQNLLPLWFTAVVLLKFTEFILTSRILKSNKSKFKFDVIGRLCAVMFYITPGIIILNNEYKVFHSVQIMLYLITIFSIVSSVNRIYGIRKLLKGDF